MSVHCKIFMNKFIVWIWGGTVYYFCFCSNAWEYPSRSSLPPHMLVPYLLSSWSRYFSTEHERDRKKCFSLMKIPDHFLVMMVCTVGSIQLWEWEILLICYTVGETLNSFPPLIDATWMLFAMAKLLAPGNKEEVGMGDSGIQHAIYRYKLCRTLCPMNSWFPSLWEKQ